MSHWRPAQAFYLDAMGLERWALRNRPTPTAVAAPAAVATPSANANVGYLYSGPAAPSWIVVALNDTIPAFFASTLGRSIAFGLGLDIQQIGYLRPAGSEVSTLTPTLSTLRGTICFGAAAQAWLLQQAQAQPLGLEAALSIQSLQIWPHPEAIASAAGKQALWQEWTQRRRP